jgi:hypothetical protein
MNVALDPLEGLNEIANVVEPSYLLDKRND